MDDVVWYSGLSASRSSQFAVELEGRKRKADAYWTSVMNRRAAREVQKYSISFNKEYMMSFGSLYRGKQRLSDGEKAVADKYLAEGETALNGEPVTVWTAPSIPTTGWVSCIVCSGITPAKKVEFIKPMPSRDLFVFYHDDCFDSLTQWKSENVHKRLPPAPKTEDDNKEDDGGDGGIVGRALDWDLEKPCDGDDS
eukprot:jgi/Mesvir1/18615/Mv17124-RA.1